MKTKEQPIQTDDFLNAGEWVNEEHAIKVLPPTIQWRRGDLTNPNPLLKNGCWQLPVEHFQAYIGDGLPVADVLHAGGVVVPSYILETIHLAVLVFRKRWFTADGEGNVTWLPQNFDHVAGMRSRLQVWALLKELNNEPVLISVKGMNSKAIEDAMNLFVQKVIKPASRLAKTNFGRHHFWLPLTSAGKIATKNNQYITPPTLAMSEFDTENLRALFTGRAVAGIAEEMMLEAMAWAKAEPIAQAEPMEINGEALEEIEF